jgi:glycerol kinase
MQTGFYPPIEDFAKSWQCDKRFTPALSGPERDGAYASWQDAVRRTLSRDHGE